MLWNLLRGFDCMESVVVSIGGSIFLDEGYIRSISAILRKCTQKVKIYVTVGGGKIARDYITLGRSLGCDETFLDELGIEITRLNAKILANVTDGEFASTFGDAVRAGSDKNTKIIVMGGTHPGHTTDAVAVMLAERVKAHRVVNATSVDGVYTADPKKNKHAKLIKKMSFDEFVSMSLSSVRTYTERAGMNFVFDPLACIISARTKIPVYVVNGRDLTSVENAILNKKFKGTLIK
jgi:uridylate kinase